MRVVSARKNAWVDTRKARRSKRSSVVLFAGVFVGCFGTLILSPFQPLETVAHVVAAPGCVSARLAGLEGALSGSPGYWAHLDQDRDGAACERLPSAQRQGAPFRDCAGARAADAAPVLVGRPGYGPHLDRDGDGIGCELFA